MPIELQKIDLKCPEFSLPNFDENIFSSLVQSAVRQQAEFLENAIKAQLCLMGHFFENQGQFFEFCKRITLVQSEEGKDMRFFLDYDFENLKGQFIARFVRENETIVETSSETRARLTSKLKFYSSED